MVPVGKWTNPGTPHPVATMLLCCDLSVLMVSAMVWMRLVGFGWFGVWMGLVVAMISLPITTPNFMDVPPKSIPMLLMFFIVVIRS